MAEKDIFFILIQIEEAHTALWPQGGIRLGNPHASTEDRCDRAAAFAATEVPTDRFLVLVDPWANPFAERYHAWPDKYVLLDRDQCVKAKSTYGAYADARLDMDCVDLIHML
jgi:hypothetical protein